MINVILLFIVFGCIILSRTLFLETFKSKPILDNSDGEKTVIPEKQIKDIIRANKDVFDILVLDINVFVKEYKEYELKKKAQ